MSGICLQCDKCGKSFYGAPYDPVAKVYRPNGYRWYETQELRNEARAAGWTMDGVDKCPECSLIKEME